MEGEGSAPLLLGITLFPFSVWISVRFEFQPISMLGYIYSGSALIARSCISGTHQATCAKAAKTRGLLAKNQSLIAAFSWLLAFSLVGSPNRPFCGLIGCSPAPLPAEPCTYFFTVFPKKKSMKIRQKYETLFALFSTTCRSHFIGTFRQTFFQASSAPPA